ncbi:MAG TPA: 2-dehydropantoate 2-reductase [Caulobacteraceae bacterium]|nr:2-dehydropantoate 2-reductase [Caulobacteraceae bacterium]
MKFAVVGAGAIGGLLGARLALAGDDVTFIARGPSLKAIRERGFRLIEADGSESVARNLRAATIDEGGEYEAVLLAVKAQQIAPIAADVADLLGPATTLVTLQNGVPWWFFHKLAGPFEGRVIEAVDPGGAIAAVIPPDRILGAVVYPAAELVAPGRVRVIEGDRFTLGDPDGSKSARAAVISEAFGRAGFKAPVSSDIRAEIWLKLWGNLAFNPISALTHATLEDMCRFAPTRALAATMMAEAREVGEKLGIRVRIPIEKRIAGAEAVGAHKTSMLQDVEAGRPLETAALTGAMVELARMTQTPSPAIDAVHACIRLLGDTLEARGGRLAIQAKS